jgi:hypothetical protein
MFVLEVHKVAQRREVIVLLGQRILTVCSIHSPYLASRIQYDTLQSTAADICPNVRESAKLSAK